MRNLKKTLAVVLAFAMVFSMGIINTFAYSDVEAGTVVDEAVSILSNLGIFEGFEDGTFRPEDTVTRAQMAAIICRTLGYESQAQSSKGATMFNDVAADHWAAGYINVAQAQQIINGYGDGNFGPDDKVTYEQAVKMVVAALGYDLVAQAKGGYPTGYLAVASANGITKSANGRVGDAAKRATVATLVYNSLEVPLMDQTSWSTGTAGNSFEPTNQTILSQYLNVEKWEGVVVNAPFSVYAADGYEADSTPVLDLDEAKKTVFSKTGNHTTTGATFPADVDCSLVDVNALAGKKVIAYVGEVEDAETNNIMVYAVAEKKGANKTVTINANQLVDAAYENDYNVAGQISYKKTGSNKVYDLDLAADAQFAVNFDELEDAVQAEIEELEEEEEEEEEEEAPLFDTEYLAGLVEAGGTITFISNDGDDKYDIIQITAYDDEAVIKEVANEDGIISFECYTDYDLADIDTEVENLLVIVYKDGVLADANALAANDTVSVVDLHESVVLLYASSKTVTGMVDSYSAIDEYVTIAGADYEVSVKSGYSVADLAKNEGVFFLNVDGQIAYADASAAKGNYGLVLSIKTTDDEYTVEVVLADGTVAKYPLYKKASITDGDADTAQAVAEKLEELMGSENAGTSTTYATTATVEDLFFEVTIKNGEIRALVNPAMAEEGMLSEDEYDAENNTYDTVTFGDSTVVFSIAPAYNADADDQALNADRIEASDVKIGKIADYFVDGEGDNFKFFAYGEEGKVVEAILGYQFQSAIAEDSDVVIVSSIKTVIYNDETAVKVTGFQGGEKVAYTLYSEDAWTVDPEDLRAGDIIMVAAADADGVVGKFDLIFKRTAAGEEEAGLNVADKTDDIYYAFGNVSEAEGKKATNAKFFFVDGFDYEELYDIDEDEIAEELGEEATPEEVAAAVEAARAEKIAKGIALRDAANYTLVDFTEGGAPAISKKSKGASIFGTQRHDSQVFVRYYDKKLVEVVVYRYLNGKAPAIAE